MAARQKLAKDALMKALRLRRDKGFGLALPVCVYDLANDMGMEVRFMDLPSLEGIYSKWPQPVIVVSSLRPPGRQAYTVGHELGHHVYGHGFRIDELLADDDAEPVDDEEFLANCFAGFLLMPKAAVARAFTCRGWNPTSSTAVQVFTIAGWLGVGYETLITHMAASLGLLSYPQSRALRKTTPKEIKAALLGMPCQENLVVVDPSWSERAIDLHVGDFVLATPGVVSEKRCIGPVRTDDHRTLLQALAPGLGRICHPDSGWSSFVRVSPRGYIGRGIFRNEEEVED
jgi:hypothetical protein